MYVLTLTNFRCHRSATFRFPDTGAVLIQGRSGAGKSTILTAIEFVLYGRCRKPCTFGTKACAVRFESDAVDGWIIERTRTPSRVTFAFRATGLELEDVAAEAEIAKTFGTEDEFITSSLISQKSLAGVLYLDSGRRLTLLETLSTVSATDGFRVNIDELKRRCNLAITKIRDESQRVYGNYEYAEREATDLRPDDVKNSAEELEPAVARKELLEEEIGLLREKSMDLAKQLREVEKWLVLETQLADARKELDIARTARESALADITDTPWADESREDVVARIERLEKWTASYARLSIIDDRIASIENDRDKSLKSLRAQLEEAQAKLPPQSITLELLEKWETWKKWVGRVHEAGVDDIDSLTDTTAELDVRIATAESVRDSVRVKCPTCSNRFHWNCVERKAVDRPPSNEGVDVDIKSLRSKRERLSILERDRVEFDPPPELESNADSWTVSSMSTTLRTVTKLSDRIESVQSGASERLVAIDAERAVIKKELKRAPDDRTVENELVSARMYLSSQLKLESRIKEIETRHSVIGLEKLVESTKASLTGKPSELPSVAKVEKRLRKTTKSIQSSEAELKHLADVIENATRQLEYQTKHEAAETLRAKYELLVKKMEGYQYLKNKIAVSEGLALEEVVTTINEYAKEFLELMFDDPISVELDLFKTTKTTGAIKPQINTKISYRGEEYEAIDQISGGEQDRISLAFVLAMNKFLHSKLLMLDEAIASLDSGLNTDIAERLVEYAKANDVLVVVVSHEANPGLFDEVVSVG